MIGHALLTYFRAIQRHKTAAVVNILGLGFGIAVFLLLALFVHFETSFERWLPGSEKVYAVHQTWTFAGVPPERSFSTMGGLLDAIRQDYSDVVGTRVMDSSATLRAGDMIVEEPVRIVDANFFDVFPFPLAEGDAATALDRPDAVVISERLALKYFGVGSARGRNLKLSIDGVERAFQVTGVLRPMPKRTEIETEILLRLDPARYDPKIFYNWGSSMLKTFLRFDSRADAEAIDGQFRSLIARRATKDIGPQARDELHLELVPLRSVHLIEPEDRLTVAAVALVAGLTLLVACINYINLATARAALRAKEVAIRKVMGATRAMLVRQFILESISTVAIAAAIGLALAELFLPLMNAVAGTALELNFFGADGVAAPLLVAIVVVGTLAGLYPAFLLSQFEPARVLASSRAPGGGRSGTRVRETLVVAQFSIAIMFMIATGVIFAQTLFVRTADLGFEKRGVLIVTSLRNRELSETQRLTFVQRARSLAGVRWVTQSDSAPGYSDVSISGSVGRPGMTQRRPTLNQTRVAQDFFASYSARLLAGRTLNPRFGMDDLADTAVAGARLSARNAVLNRAAAALLGFETPAAAIGKAIEMDGQEGRRPLTIVGVIEDMRFESLRGSVAPTIYLFQSKALENSVASLRFAGDEAELTARVQQLWRTIAPQVPFEAVTVERSVAAFYAADDQRSRLFLSGAVMAVFISCLGLYGLATFTTQQRTKEIGIRKALGASRRDILTLIGGQILRPVLLANLIAWPLAYLAMRGWLDGFDRRIDLGIVFFIAAGGLAVTIAAMTVFSQVVRISRAEPAWALRHE